MDINEPMKEPPTAPGEDNGAPVDGPATTSGDQPGTTGDPSELRDVSDREIEDFAYGPDPDDPFVDHVQRADTSQPQQPPPPPGTGQGRGQRMSPPPPGRTTPGRRLYRHPKGQLGGVASGLAHYLAIDVALIRFLLVLSVFTGVMPFLYIAAWIAVPKAPVWPPPGPAVGSSPARLIESRAVRTAGLIAVGLIVLGSLPGGFSGLVTAVALVGGGVWLLNRSPKPNNKGPEPYGDPITPPPPGYQDPFDDTPFAETWERPAYAYETTAPGAAPPPPRNWRPLKWLGGLAVVAALIPIGIIGLLITSGDDGAFNGPVGEQFVSPSSLEDMNSYYDMTAGDMTLDLSKVNFRGETRSVGVNAGVGQITVVVPPDIKVVHSLEAKLGEVDTSRLIDDNSVTNGQLNLDVSLRAGEIRILTGSCGPMNTIFDAPEFPPMPEMPEVPEMILGIDDADQMEALAEFEARERQVMAEFEARQREMVADLENQRRDTIEAWANGDFTCLGG